MAEQLEHRGPDDTGSWADQASSVAFGFRRLSIIDLSEQGHQPMSSASGRFTVVFNGEVYNHGELREDLERAGWAFRGHSDTEVILASFERWGVADAVPRFVGMFAIAAWDAETRSLSLIRDRLGIKPLYIYSQPGLITFGSELKALYEGPAFDRELDPDALADFLRYLYIPAPHTIFRHVRKLPPGHILTVSDPATELPDSDAYWSVDDVVSRGLADPFRGSDEEAILQLEDHLSDAVALRMYADVPVGALLSGGIDSSTVVALMQQHSNIPVKTYSIAFEEAEHNEGPHAARVAAHLGTDHTELLVTGEDSLKVVPDLSEIFDEPLADPSQIPTFLVSRLARREVTVALSGDGGDELFAGYNRYTYGERVIGRALRMPGVVRRAVAAGIGSVSSRSWDRLHAMATPLMPGLRKQRLAGEKVQKLGHLMGWTSEPDMYRSLMSAWQHPELMVAGGTGRHGAFEGALEKRDSLGLLHRMMLADQLVYLPDDLLAKVDRASMAVSLEARVPILDHRVAEFAWRLPRALKIRDGQGKWLLRQVLYRHVPKEMVDRPKVGFSVPIGSWLRGPLREWAEDLLAPTSLQRTGIVRSEPVRRAWAEFQNDPGRSGQGIWALVMFQAWSERWLN
jgi:asparagine synthase (glutamine-hydrolysing)